MIDSSEPHRDVPICALHAVFLAVSNPTLNGHHRPPWRRTMAFLGLVVAYANRAARWIHRSGPWRAHVAAAGRGKPAHGGANICGPKAWPNRHYNRHESMRHALK